MNIAIIGTGTVGRALGGVWLKKGHHVGFGARDPKSEKARAAAESGSFVVTGLKEAVAAAEAVLLAVPWAGALDALRAAGNLAGKIIIDPINSFTPDLNLSVGFTTSVAEEIAKAVPSAKVVKAFNTLGVGNIANLVFDGQTASGFICGDDAAAKAKVSGLCGDAGFDVVDCGPLQNARMLEPLAQLWGRLAFMQGLGPNIAFKLLHR
jgi:8-hydroxy-5-deazaflavin:NADPH oxidoreductase